MSNEFRKIVLQCFSEGVYLFNYTKGIILLML